MEHHFYFCPRCSYVFAIPIELSDQSKVAIARMVKNKNFSQAIMTLVKAFPHPENISLADAKAIVNHIPHEDDSCTGCSGKLSERGFTNCQQCKALNFNW